VSKNSSNFKLLFHMNKCNVIASDSYLYVHIVLQLCSKINLSFLLTLVVKACLSIGTILIWNLLLICHSKCQCSWLSNFRWEREREREREEPLKNQNDKFKSEREMPLKTYFAMEKIGRYFTVCPREFAHSSKWMGLKSNGFLSRMSPFECQC